MATVLGLKKHYGLNVSLVSGPTEGPEGSLESAFKAQGGELKIIPSLKRPVSPFADLRTIFALVMDFRRTKPGIVHTHSAKAGILGRTAARLCGVPLIIHGIHGPSFGRFQGTLANVCFEGVERLAGSLTDHFFSVANAMIDQYQAAGIGVPTQYDRVFSGFDVGRFEDQAPDLHLRRTLGIQPDDLVIGKIARLFELKGHRELLPVIAKLQKRFPKVKLLLVGDGVLKQELEQQAKALGIESKVIFAGLVPPAEVPNYIGLMDVLVHLSWREGLPRALPQGLAGGVPVVAYDLDGAPEVCLSGVNGFLVQPGHESELLDRLDDLLCDPARRKAFGRAGQERVMKDFSEEKMVHDTYRLYRKLWLRFGESEKKDFES